MLPSIYWMKRVDWRRKTRGWKRIADEEQTQHTLTQQNCSNSKRFVLSSKEITSNSLLICIDCDLMGHTKQQQKHLNRVRWAVVCVCAHTSKLKCHCISWYYNRICHNDYYYLFSASFSVIHVNVEMWKFNDYQMMESERIVWCHIHRLQALWCWMLVFFFSQLASPDLNIEKRKKTIK